MAHDPPAPPAPPDPDALVELRRCANEFKAGIIHALLEDAGIDARVGPTEKTLPGVFGTTGFREAVVLVRARDLSRAQAALEANRQDSVDLDWSEIDVGEPEPDDQLAARIAAGMHTGSDWWRSGWTAAFILIVIALFAAPINADIAWLLALAGVIAGAGSAGSWMISRARSGTPRRPEPDPEPPPSDRSAPS